MIMYYRKKPVVIEAKQLIKTDDIHDNIAEIIYWAKDYGVNIWGESIPEVYLVIPTLEGPMIARNFDYIIKGVKDEFYPCKPEIFEATYEAVNE
jgi:hypothetical protein